MKAVQLQAYGNPADVVKLVDVPDLGAPGPDDVVIATEASPINGTDLSIIAGRYGYLPPLPCILGVEGVGRVTAIGRNVKHLKEGDRALIPVMHPAWAERIKTDAPWLRPLPNGDVQQLSMLGINPATAYLLLTDIVPLKRGDWVIQNGANSAVGRAVIAIARSLGIKTVNVVRREALFDEIKSIGGDVVLVEGPELPKLVAAATGKAKICLAFDMVADTATTKSDELGRAEWNGSCLCRLKSKTAGWIGLSIGLQQPVHPRVLADQLVQDREAGQARRDVRMLGVDDCFRRDLSSDRRELPIRKVL